MKLKNFIPGYGMIDSFLHPEKGHQKAFEAAQPYYNESQGYLRPYTEHGNEVYPELQGAMHKLLNPGQLEDEWLNDYQQSEASKMHQARARNEGNWAANSMGIGGSTPALQAIQAGNAEIGSQDEMRALDRYLNMYGQGINTGQNIYGQGANSAGQMATNAAGFGSYAGQSAYGQQNAPGEQFGGILKALLAAIGGGSPASSGGGNMNRGNSGNGWSTTGGGY